MANSKKREDSILNTESPVKCAGCSKTDDVGPRKFEFKYQGFTFRCSRTSFWCDKCTKKEVIRNFKRFNDFLSCKKGEPFVNWKRYFHILRSSFENSDGFFYCFTDVLRYLGILSLEAKDHWQINHNGIQICGLPSRSGEYLYFTQKDDAIAYAISAHENTQVSWEVHHIDIVVTSIDQ